MKDKEAGPSNFENTNSDAIEEIPGLKKYLQNREKLLKYVIGEIVKVLRTIPKDQLPEKSVFGLYGASGSGKSTLLNYLIRILDNQDLYYEYSPIGAKSKQGSFSVISSELGTIGVIYDTRGKNSDTDEGDKAFILEILKQLTATMPEGYCRRPKEDRSELLDEICAFELRVPAEQLEIHLPIFCIPIHANKEQKRDISRLMYQLTQLNVSPVVSITNYDKKNNIEEYKNLSEVQIIERFADELSISVDDIFMFKCYRSASEKRDYIEEAAAIEQLHKLFHKAERNMRFKHSAEAIANLIKNGGDKPVINTNVPIPPPILAPRDDTTETRVVKPKENLCITALKYIFWSLLIYLAVLIVIKLH